MSVVFTAVPAVGYHGAMNVAKQLSVWALMLVLLSGCGEQVTPADPFDASAAAQLRALTDERQRFGVLSPSGLRKLLRLRERFPDAVEVRELLVEVYLGRQDFPALAALMLASRQQSAADSLQLAKVLCKAERFEHAAALIEGLQTGQDSAELRWLAAYTAFQRGEYARAAAELDADWQGLLAAGHDSAIIVRGLLHSYAGENERAIALLREGLRLKPQDIGAANALARVLAAEGRPGEAAEWFARVEALQTAGKERQRRLNKLNDASSSLELAWQERDFANCERSARTILELGDQTMQRNAWLWLVEVFRAQGREADARQAEAQALALRPGDAP